MSLTCFRCGASHNHLNIPNNYPLAIEQGDSLFHLIEDRKKNNPLCNVLPYSENASSIACFTFPVTDEGVFRRDIFDKIDNLRKQNCGYHLIVVPGSESLGYWQIRFVTQETNKDLMPGIEGNDQPGFCKRKHTQDNS